MNTLIKVDLDKTVICLPRSTRPIVSSSSDAVKTALHSAGGRLLSKGEKFSVLTPADVALRHLTLLGRF